MSLIKNLEFWKNQEFENTQDIFYELEQSRKDWDVSSVVKNPNTEDQILDCFSRIIAVSLELELPVGSFIRALIERQNDIPVNAFKGLVLNIEDEEKHFKAFKSIANAYEVQPLHYQKAANFRQKLLHIKTNPLIKARDLETILFIPLQTALRFFGSQSLERIISFISLDEFRHIQYNWEISNILNIGFDKEYEKLVVEIARWVFEPLQTTSLKHDFWTDCVYELQQEGECSRLSDLMNYGIHRSPFELSNATY